MSLVSGTGKDCVTREYSQTRLTQWALNTIIEWKVPNILDDICLFLLDILTYSMVQMDPLSTLPPPLLGPLLLPNLERYGRLLAERRRC